MVVHDYGMVSVLNFTARLASQTSSYLRIEVGVGSLRPMFKECRGRRKTTSRGRHEEEEETTKKKNRA